MNSKKANQDRWPFEPVRDPMQPGDHEPARLRDEAERVQKQSGRGARQPSPDYRKAQEKRR